MSANVSCCQKRVMLFFLIWQSFTNGHDTLTPNYRFFLYIPSYRENLEKTSNVSYVSFLGSWG